MRIVAGSTPGRRCTGLYCASGAQETLPCKWWGVMTSPLDLPSLALLSVDGCRRLQLGVTYWATAVALQHIIDN